MTKTHKRLLKGVKTRTDKQKLKSVHHKVCSYFRAAEIKGVN